MNNEFKNADFLDDEEKMRDFTYLTKEEFLSSYSYLTEDEYDNTYKRYYAKRMADALRKFAEKPQNIDNFESYLEHCFIDWKEIFANTPEKIIGELENFAEIEV